MKKYILAIALSFALAPLNALAFDITPEVGVSVSQQEVYRGVVESGTNDDFAAKASLALGTGPFKVTGTTYANWNDKQFNVYRLEAQANVGTSYNNGLFADAGVLYTRPVDRLEKHDIELYVGTGIDTQYVKLGVDGFYSVVDDADIFIEPFVQGQVLKDTVYPIALKVSAAYVVYDRDSFKDEVEYVEGTLGANVSVLGFDTRPYVSYTYILGDDLIGGVLATDEVNFGVGLTF